MREANWCADVLAKMEISNNFIFVVSVEPPPMVGILLAFGKANMFCNKLINSNIKVYPVLTIKKKKVRVSNKVYYLYHNKCIQIR